MITEPDTFGEKARAAIEDGTRAEPKSFGEKLREMLNRKGGDEISESQPRKSIDYKERLKSYTPQYFLCEYCDQLFPSYDMFYDHRMASDVDAVRDEDSDMFQGKREISAGDQCEDHWQLGKEPCTGKNTTENGRDPDGGRDE